MRHSILLLFTFFLSMACYPQDDLAINSDTLRKDALNIYMNASDFLKREVPFVNYIRDLKDADLYVIRTVQHTGSGGSEYTYFLVGQGRFAGMNDTITFTTSYDDTEDQSREAEARTFKQGLLRYVVKTPLSKFINVSFNQPIDDEVSTDKWDNWVFRASLNGFFMGQSSYSNINAFGSISARRITSDWKISMSANYSFGRDKFDIDGDIYESITNSRSGDLLIVRSLGDHWSAGGTAEIGSSTYNNFNLRTSLMPGIEYDIFPYSESTRRQIRFLYTLGYAYNVYTDSTIFNKTQEGLMIHRLNAAFEVIQKWGSIDLSLSWLNHLRNWSENYLSLDGSIRWRIAKGLSLNLGGSFSFIHNQISLVKGGATAEEILLRRKEIKTNFSYFTHFGFSYTFGSIYNNVVNPRFGSSGGGGGIMIIN